VSLPADVAAVLAGERRWAVVEADCRDVLPWLPIGACVLVTDPPYGIGEAGGKNRTRSKLAPATDYGDDAWDDEPAPQATIDAAIRVCRWAIVFGGNYYALPPSSCWLVWDKVNGESDFADCELAWTNLPGAARRIVWQWNGMLRRGRETRHHPTQKPVGVMQWAVERLPRDAPNVILDPFAGSGTTGVAALRLGRRFIGIEREPRWAALSCERLTAEEQGSTLQARRAGQMPLYPVKP